MKKIEINANQIGQVINADTANISYSPQAASPQAAEPQQHPSKPLPQPTASTPALFISYCRRDWETHVRPLVDHLREHDLTVWIDQDLIQGGQDWLDEINAALQSCAVMVLCVSAASLDSQFCKMEYRYFIEEKKHLIPVMLEDTPLPAGLRGIQYLNYSNLDILVERLHALLNA